MATTPNTSTSYYLDTKDEKEKCAKDLADVDKKCAPDPKNKSRGKGRPKSRQTHKDGHKDADWVLDHCGPLMVQPGLGNFEEWRQEFGDIQGSIKKIADTLKDNVIAKLEQEALEYTGKQIAKLAVRRGLTGWIPIVGWVMTAVDVAVTAHDAIGKVKAINETVTDLKGTVDRLKEAADKISGTLNKYKDQLKDFGKLSKEQQKKVAREVMADIQSAYGDADPCLRARKCLLVPFNKDLPYKWAGKGCCPGQTGHHLMPDAMFRDPVGTEKARADYKAKHGNMKGWSRDMAPTRACWSNYKEGPSPTICVEGNNQYSGSHGAMHKLTSEKLKFKGALGKADMPYTDARDLVLDEVSKIYGCSKECLQAQLDNYYCGKAASKGPGCPDCKHATVRPHDGTGEQPESQGGAED